MQQPSLLLRSGQLRNLSINARLSVCRSSVTKARPTVPGIGHYAVFRSSRVGNPTFSRAVVSASRAQSTATAGSTAEISGRVHRFQTHRNLSTSARNLVPANSRSTLRVPKASYIQALSDELFRNQPDVFPAFLVGKFHEIYGQATAIPIKELNLTAMKGKLQCGWPKEHKDRQVQVFVRQKGRKLAIYEPYQSSQIMSGNSEYRKARVYTPGTLPEEHFWDPEKPSSLLAIACKVRSQLDGTSNDLCHLFSYDVRTGEAYDYVTPISTLGGRLESIRPAEIVLHPAIFADKIHPIHAILDREDAVLSAPVEGNIPDGPSNIPDGPGNNSSHLLMQHYLKETLYNLSRPPLRTRTLQSLARPSQMRLEGSALSALEIRNRSINGSRAGSLLAAVKRTDTKDGARLLAERLCSPSTDLQEIQHRLNLVTAFIHHADLRIDLKAHLRKFPNISRLIASLTPNITFQALFDLEACLYLCKQLSLAADRYLFSLSENPKAETAAILAFLSDFPGFETLSTELRNIRIAEDRVADDDLQERAANLRSMEEIKKSDLVESTAWAIRADFNQELAHVHAVYDEREAELNALLVSLQRKHKLPKALEVVHDSKRRQAVFKITLKQSQRLTTDPDLTVVDSNKVWAYVYSADAQCLFMLKEEAITGIRDAENRLKAQLQTTVELHVSSLNHLCRKLSELDVAMSSAELAVDKSYVCPRFVSRNAINIIGGRHPVIEDALLGRHKEFVPNDIALGRQKGNFVLITGPNMGGKSTFLRQVAIIVLLAQAGLYVPASSASLSIVDRIFTRIGAQDDLFLNKSTFMQEMSEMSTILRNLTPKSLVLLDEVGRGTSMVDGLAISTAISRYLIKHGSPKVLFATHLHELKSHLSDLNITYMCTDVYQTETGGITFSYALRDGINDQSHGLLTAELAGIPEEVLETARATSADILAKQQKSQRLLDREDCRDSHE